MLDNTYKYNRGWHGREVCCLIRNPPAVTLPVTNNYKNGEGRAKQQYAKHKITGIKCQYLCLLLSRFHETM